MNATAVLFIAIFLLASCTNKQPTIFEATPNFTPLAIDGKIPIKAALKKESNKTALVVVIEGDGRAWIDRHTPSNDPTPKSSFGQKIALNINAPSVLYLARPCQFLDDKEREACTVSDWTNGRFSQKLLLLTDNAITKIKNRK